MYIYIHKCFYVDMSEVNEYAEITYGLPDMHNTEVHMYTFIIYI